MNAHPEAVLAALEKKLKSAIYWPQVISGGSGDGREPKRGRGPGVMCSDEQDTSVDSLTTLIAQYVEADLRAQLYFNLPVGEGTIADRSRCPLREDSEGKLIDPYVVVGGSPTLYAQKNLQWEAAPIEWGFELQPGALLIPDKSMTSLVKNLHPVVDGEFWSWHYEIARLSTVDRSKGHKYRIKRL